ncbi:4-hydroxy-tetrahydrodipicolinate synthase [Alteribacillus persepolensis]|uniref:4-hydroxy-tetrahydrodipicolinate synthase n=1 Tax=Alteribacillus persepolensis TaxID=568899 RepID=A0A1G7Z923_9BACI|nr:4-hydroxy-tetrahydrodipicolinate synthase [Alteribacillus persepolensis]SDH05233.1 4-hydroxy-tetrahydrodipicolinate synthase [Alteribacillus persepolensis]
MHFGRISTAMVTPFDKSEEIDYSAVTKLVNHLIANGSDSLVIAGTTGESPTLSKEEKLTLFEHVVQVVNGRVPVIAGTGCNNTKASIELTKQAEKTGVDAVMLVTPYYSKPNQEGMYLHFKTVAASTNLPVMLYNIPGRSAAGLNPETIIRLSEINNIVAVKEASGDLDAMATIIQHTPDNFLLYSGDDSLTLPVMSIGGAGVVSISSHIIGNEMQDMVQSFLNGHPQYASKCHRELLSTMKAMFTAPSPAPVKAALEMQGVISGDVRLPMVRLNEEEMNVLRGTLQPKTAFYVS